MSTSHLTLKRAKALRGNQTDAEQRLWYHLRAHRFLGLKFKRQKPVGPYIVDFVAVEQGLIVELDGAQHAEQGSYDTARTRYLAEQGYQVLRFWNDDMLRDTDAVLEQIRLAARTGKTLSPRLAKLGTDSMSVPSNQTPSPTSGRGELNGTD